MSMSSRAAAGIIAIVSMGLVAGCSSPGSGSSATSAASASSASCLTGKGSDGSSSTLTLQRDGGSFTGSYVNTPAGSGAGLKYDVAGTMDGTKFTSTWSVGSTALTVTGQWTASGIVLDDPGHLYSTDRFAPVSCSAAASATAVPAAAGRSLTAEQIAVAMHLSRQPHYTAYTASTDPNNLLGRQDGYTSKVSWGGFALTDGDGQNGGSIEVFATPAEALARKTYVSSFGAMLSDGYDYVIGTALLRLEPEYLPAQARTLDAEFKKAAPGA